MEEVNNVRGIGLAKIGGSPWGEDLDEVPRLARLNWGDPPPTRLATG